MNEYQPDFASHPGETLRDILEEKGMTQSQLAKQMGRPRKTINEIIQGKASITPQTAIQLERVLGASAEFWINREGQYRLNLERIKNRTNYVEQIENALVSALCIIENEAGMSGVNGRVDHEIKLMKWCEELKQESGVDFDLILNRITED